MRVSEKDALNRLRRKLIISKRHQVDNASAIENLQLMR